MARICIISPGALGSNPRVVKEADALAEAGHAVHVISTRTLDAVDRLDAAVLEGRAWTSERIDLRRRSTRLVPGLRQRLARVGHRLTGMWTAQAYSLFDAPLARAARRRPADLYIAHYVAALEPAAHAARAAGGRYAYDAEDFHLGDDPEAPAFAAGKALIRRIESRWLPGCASITAASPGIADAYARTYGVAAPTVILNVFPKGQGVAQASHAGSVKPGPTLYWFSQTIGPDRGLECAVEAIALCEAAPHLHLRGSSADGFASALQALADRLGVGDRLHFHEPAPPQSMEELASAFDVGLAAETGYTAARQVALTNKQFTYLVAGIPVAMSDTAGHRAFAVNAEGAVFLFKSGDAADLARVLDDLLGDPERLAAARGRAHELGHARYNWDVEKHRLLECVERALGEVRT